jgi:hypothetical protein
VGDDKGFGYRLIYRGNWQIIGFPPSGKLASLPKKNLGCV